MLKAFALILVSLAFLSACSHGHKKDGHHKGQHKMAKMNNEGSPLVAHLKGTKNRPQVEGSLELTPKEEKGLLLTGEIKGLKPNSTHGFHIHEYGDCSAEDATSAGAHYNPDEKPHNLPEEQTRHAGDLGNITTDEKGVAKIEIEAERLTAVYGPYPVAGRAFIVHADKDTGKGDSGEAGARLACGVIGFGEVN